MGIELKFTDMCEDCPAADLELVVNTYNMDHKGLSVYSVKCKHECACTRLYEMAETGKLEHICLYCEIFERDQKGMIGYCPLHNSNVRRDDKACFDFRPKGGHE